MLKAFWGILILGLILSFQKRQDPMAESILNAVSKKYKKMAGFSASFKHESETNSGNTVGSQKGEILVSGSKYQLKTEKMTLICDGNTVWNVNSKAKEVNISHYEPEPDDITPDRIYSFYQRGYKFIFMGEVRVKGKTWQTIDLEPENLKKEISKIRLFVDKTSLTITKWIVFERGSNNREVFEVEKFEALAKINPQSFQFSKKQFPGLKVIDLR